MIDLWIYCHDQETCRSQVTCDLVTWDYPSCGLFVTYQPYLFILYASIFLATVMSSLSINLNASILYYTCSFYHYTYGTLPPNYFETKVAIISLIKPTKYVDQTLVNILILYSLCLWSPPNLLLIVKKPSSVRE